MHSERVHRRYIWSSTPRLPASPIKKKPLRN